MDFFLKKAELVTSSLLRSRENLKFGAISKNKNETKNEIIPFFMLYALLCLCFATQNTLFP